MAKKNGFNEVPTRFSQEQETPESKYSKAREEWDYRVGSATVRAKNWRLIAFVLAGITTIAISGLIFQSAKAMVKPYIIEVDKSSGAVMRVTSADEDYIIKEKNIEYFLQDFIEKTRSVSRDEVVYGQNWEKAYSFLSKEAGVKMDSMISEEKQSDKLKNGISTQVKMKYIGKVDTKDNMYQLRWEENNYKMDGTLKDSIQMTAFAIIDFGKPKNAAMMKNNPLGLIIKDISWNREM